MEFSNLKSKEILEAMPHFLHAIHTWRTKHDELCTKFGKLSDELNEIEDWGLEEVADRLRSASINPEMSRWTQHINNLADVYNKTFETCNIFRDDLQEFQQMIKSQFEIWNNPHDTYFEGMTVQEIKTTTNKWKERIQVLNDLETTLNGLVTKWEEELKEEIQESNHNCVFMLDSLM